jgi:hypothetical protein
MRLLSKNEQDICLRILNGDGDNNYLGNIIDHKLEGVRISITRNPVNVELLFTISKPIPTEEETSWTIERMREISVEILTVVNLINLLEKDGYIMLLQRTNQLSNNSTFGQGIGNLPAISSHFVDQKVSQLLIEFTTKEIFVTEEFRRFCRKKFVARDEQRFRRQIAVTTSALIVAGLALIVNTTINLLPRFTGGTKIKQDQVDSLRKDLRLINTSLDTLNSETKKLPTRTVEEIKKRLLTKTRKKNASR